MKNFILIISLLTVSFSALAQNISLKNDTIFNNSSVFAIFKKDIYAPDKYFVLSLKNENLIEIHHTQEPVQGSNVYMLNFLNNHQQAILIESKDAVEYIVQKIVVNKLVSGGLVVDSNFETQFVLAHHVPDGFVDSREFNDRIIRHKR